MTNRPNFLVLMTDQQRADHLGCYGNSVVQTPNLDALSSRGLRFENFYVSIPICQPNRAALLTGQMPSVNGCRQNGIPVSLDDATFVDVLREAGYRTGLVGKAHFQNVSNIPAKPRQHHGVGEAPSPAHVCASQRIGAEYQSEVRGMWASDPRREIPTPYYGFDHLRLCIGHGDQVEGHYTSWLHNRLNGGDDPRGRDAALEPSTTPQVWRTSVPETLYPTIFVAEEACAFLKDPSDALFFLQVSFPDPHHPFTPPGHYYDLYDPAEIELPESFGHPTGARLDLPESVLQAYAKGDAAPDAYWPFHVDAEIARRMIALNYGAITMVDDAIGQVLVALEASGRAENTIVVFMSDHGDYLGDHGTMLKHGVHTRGLIRVPFLWADPSVGRGVIDLHASAIDFAPMVLQRAGLQLPIGMQGQDVLGEGAEDLPVLIEDPGIGVYGDPDANTSLRSIVFDGWRLTVFEGSGLGELYNLNADQYELKNLWADPGAQGRKMRMLEHLIQRQIALRDTSLVATNQA